MGLKLNCDIYVYPLIWGCGILSHFLYENICSHKCKLAVTYLLFFFSSLKVFFASVQSGGSSQIYFMTLGQNVLFNW